MGAGRAALLTVLRELRPDVVGLQEVWERDGENLARWFAEGLGLHWAWEPSRAPGEWQRRAGEPGTGFGNAVLSRWPVVERAVAQLPAPDEPDDGRRCCSRGWPRREGTYRSSRRI